MTNEEGGVAGDGDDNVNLETLTELIRNITQLTAKGKGMPSLLKKNQKQRPNVTVVTSTTRVMADETDKVAGRISILKPSTPTTTAAAAAAEKVKEGADNFANSSEGGTRQQEREVHTEVDKDNKKIEVVYAESVQQAPTPLPFLTTVEWDGGEDDKKRTFDDTQVAEATVQPSATTVVEDDEDGLKRDTESPPTPPEVTTPLTPTLQRRREQQKLLLKKHLAQRNSLLTVLNATVAAEIDPKLTSPNATLPVSISQRELAKVADALKALRNLAALCTNKCNGSTINGVVSSKCLNRTTTTSTFALERRNRVVNVLAKTHEEVAARTKAAAASGGRRLRKLRVCVKCTTI